MATNTPHIVRRTRVPSGTALANDLQLAKGRCWAQYEDTGDARWLDAYLHIVDAYREAKAAAFTPAYLFEEVA